MSVHRVEHPLLAVVAASLIFSASQTAIADEALVWVGCGISKKAYVEALAKGYEARTGQKIIIDGGGATRGIREVSSQKAHIGGSCRHSLYGEGAEANTRLAPVGWDALVAIVHPGNPVDSLTIDNLRDIYLGKVSNWKQVGGPDRPLKLYFRKGKVSGVGYTIRQLIFDNVNQEFVGGQEFASTGPLEKALEADPEAIAMTGISSARKRNVKILALNGKEPSYENVRSGAYLLYRPLYLAYNPDNPRVGDVKKFIEFAYSDEGQEIMRKNGTVPYLEATNLFARTLAERLTAQRTGGL
ncbi:MAG: substrate-binding domain-containing protein [Chromatiales bacterium]|nr:substrate-binding domain-containing protein [Chromatiales bacterium]